MPPRQAKTPCITQKNGKGDEPGPTTGQPNAPVKRAPGRPKKSKEAMAMPADADSNQLRADETDSNTLLQPPAIRQKRRRQKGNDGDSNSPTIPTRQPEDDNHELTELPAAKKQKTTKEKRTAEKTQRTLPAREGRNVNPAAVPGVKPATRRSQAEVAAELEAKTKEAEEAYERYKNAQLALAHLQVDEEDSPGSPNLRLSAAISRKRTRLSLSIQNESESENFDLDAVVGSSDELSDDAPSKPKAPVKLKIKNGKPKEKGLRDKVDIMAGDLRKDTANGGRGRKRSKGNTINDEQPFSALDLAPQKYKDAGLVHVPASDSDCSTKNGPARTRNIAKPSQRDGNIEVLGGLADEDAAGERPSHAGTHRRHNNSKEKGEPERPSYPDGLKRDKSRSNGAVEVFDSSESDSELPLKVVKSTKPGPTKATQRGARSADKTNNQGKASSRTKGSATLSLTVETFLHDDQWKESFMPSLIHSFYVSEEPLKHFKQSSVELRAIVQRVFDMAFPHVRYEITEKDKILRTAYSRIKTKRSLIASDAVKMVCNHFATKEYLGKPALIKHYARWALRGDGPAYNLHPTPSDCTVSPTDDNYIPPDGIFQSHFMRTIAEKFLQHAIDSKVEPAIGAESPPVGLYALIAASLERAFKSYASGIFSEPKSFTIESSWPSVNAFIARCQKLSNRRWGEILASPTDDDDVIDELDVSNISAFRDNFYIPESPVKPSASH